MVQEAVKRALYRESGVLGQAPLSVDLGTAFSLPSLGEEVEQVVLKSLRAPIVPFQESTGLQPMDPAPPPSPPTPNPLQAEQSLNAPRLACRRSLRSGRFRR